MQELRPSEQMHYASLGFRGAALLVDMLIVLLASSVILAVLSVAGVVDLGIRNGASLSDIYNSSLAAPIWLTPLEYGIVFLYFTLFELGGATPGKRVFRLSIAKDDGTRATSAAVVVRNAIRIPEMYLLYVPSVIACLISKENKRLGDLAARTVVVRRGAAPAAAPAAQMPPAPPAPAPPPSTAPDLSASVAAFKTAALTVAGAHRAYLQFSEAELAAAEDHADEASPYAPGYIAAWYTLTDAVFGARKAFAAAEASAASAGTTLGDACADQPDLERLSREFGPYFASDSDDQIHDAYMSVARGETAV